MKYAVNGMSCVETNLSNTMYPDFKCDMVVVMRGHADDLNALPFTGMVNPEIADLPLTGNVIYKVISVGGATMTHESFIVYMRAARPLYRFQ